MKLEIFSKKKKRFSVYLQVLFVVNFALHLLLPVRCPGVDEALPELVVEDLGLLPADTAVPLHHPSKHGSQYRVPYFMCRCVFFV